MKLTSWILAFLLLTVVTVIALTLSGVRPHPDMSTSRLLSPQQLVARGEYLAQIAGCKNCHSDLKDPATAFAGGRRFETRFGTYYSPNITPDEKTGIGQWKKEEFMVAMQYGVSPKGAHYYPVFPYTSLSSMQNEDLLAIHEYLRSIPPVERKNRKNSRALFVWRNSVQLWKRLAFERGIIRPDPLRSAAWNRGRYLADAVMHCGECHTPRNFIGMMDKTRYLAGDNSRMVMNTDVPNITQNRVSGIGYWSEHHLLRYFKSGMRPDGSYSPDELFGVAYHTMAYLSDEDARALVTYLKSVPASH